MATDLERLEVLIEANTKQYSRAMDKLQKDTNRAINASTKSVAGLDTQFSKMHATVGKFAGLLGVSLGVAGLVQLGNAARNAVAGVGDLADAAGRAGVSAEKLQVFRFALSQAGGEASDADAALTKLTLRIGDAATNAEGPAAKAFAALGIKILDAQGNIRDTDAVLKNAMNRLAGVGSQAEASAIAGEIFGDKLGPKLVTLLMQGGSALTDVEDKMRSLGNLMSNEMVAAGDRLDDKFNEIIDTLDVKFKQAVVGSIGLVEQWVNSLKKLDQPGGIPALPFGIGEPQVNRAEPGVAEPQTVEELWKSLGWTMPRKPGPRVNFGKTGPDTQAKKYDQLAASLGTALSNLTATDREQAIANDLLRLGTEATDKQKESIAALSGQLFDQKKALEDFNATARYFGETINDALGDLIIRGESAEDVLRNIVARMAEAALQASLLGSGPLAALFGTASSTSGGLGGILGSLFGGFRAGGGSVDSGKAYMVGEKGPEMFIPNTSGRIAANANGGGSSRTSFNIVVNGARGNTEIREMVQRGVSAGLGAYDYSKARQSALAG